MKYVFWFLGLGVFWLSWGGDLKAQNNDGLNLVVSPLPINLVTTPGSTVSAQLKIKNGGLEAEVIRVSLMKFDAQGDDGFPRLLDRATGDDYFDWVDFSENDFEILPNEWKTITAIITVPKEAAFGYYYAVVFSRKDDPILENSARSTKLVGAVATLVLLEVRVPQAVRDVEVAEFVSSRRVYEFLPVSFSIKLRNRGNVHVAPKGNIFIDWGDKKDVGIMVINENQGNVLPNSFRVFESSWNDGFPVYTDKTDKGKMVVDEKGKVVKELSWDWSKVPRLRMGKFSAKMLLVYDDGQRDVPIEGELSFWVIPWRLLLGLGLVLFLLIFGLYATVGKMFLAVIKKRR